MPVAEQAQPVTREHRPKRTGGWKRKFLKVERERDLWRERAETLSLAIEKIEAGLHKKPITPDYGRFNNG